ncbi:MAG: hypothetical protein LBN10_11545 [Propionibacteriaceae bacterium]|jgi:mannitol-1-phosphate 5-dehydrogenase|nr:hypothetical protein [Propionibacteriaceae bacterium]
MSGDTSDKIVIFGAGAVGRGFIGELFSDAGWLVSFLDVNERVVDTLRTEGCYEHRTVGPEVTVKQVGPVTAGYSTDTDYVSAEIATASVIATSVGAAVLPEIAPVLQKALLDRLAAGGDPIDILLCENLPRAAFVMRNLLNTGLNAAEKSLLNSSVGLVETSVGRMIPVPDQIHSPTTIAAEPYRFLPIDVAAMKGPSLRVPGLVCDETVDFEFFTCRKLYIHNMGHYLCGLLAQQAGYELLWQGAVDPGIRYFTRAAMVESALALAKVYNRPADALIEHVDDLLHRFDNKALGDTVARVVRDPLRKLAPDDRVFGAFSAAIEAGSPRRHLSLAVAAGAVNLEVTEGWQHRDTELYLRATRDRTGTDWSDADWALLQAQITALRHHGFSFAEQRELIGDCFDPPSIP